MKHKESRSIWNGFLVFGQTDGLVLSLDVVHTDLDGLHVQRE